MILDLKPHTLLHLSSDITYPCSAVPKSGEGAVVRFPDGTTRQYGYTVYLSVACGIISPGEWVRLVLPGGVELDLEVLGVMRYKTYVKLWL